MKGALICRLHFDFDAVEKHPIDAFSCNVKTARPRLKTDTIASIEKKSLLSTGKYTYKARVLSFQHFEYDYIMMTANNARKVWLHVGLECIIIFHYVFISITFPNTIFNKVTLKCVRYLSLMRHVPAT